MNRQFGVWGSKDYDREEIRAELATAMLSAELSVPTTIESHAAYIGSFVKRLKEDKFEIFRAARDAGKIADFVTGRLVLDAVAEPTRHSVDVSVIAPMMKTEAVLMIAQPVSPAFNLANSPALKALVNMKPKRATRTKASGQTCNVPAPMVAESAPTM